MHQTQVKNLLICVYHLQEIVVFPKLEPLFISYKLLLIHYIYNDSGRLVCLSDSYT